MNQPKRKKTPTAPSGASKAPASKPRARPPSFPFPFFGEGVAAARKARSVFVVFHKAPKKVERASLTQAAPRVFNVVVWHESRVLEVGHVGELQWAVARSYRARGPRFEEGDATVEQWSALSRELERWLRRVHRGHPLHVVVAPSDDEYGTSFGEWHRWSSLERGPLGLWRELAELASDNALPKQSRKTLRELVAWVIEQYRRDLAELDAAAQKARISALDAKAKSLLSRCGGLPEVKVDAAPPKGPSRDELFDVWRESVRGHEGDRELRYRVARGDDEASLYDLATALFDAGCFADAADVCLDALLGPVRYPDHWHDALILALVRAKRWEQAVVHLPTALMTVPLYSADRLVVAWILLLERARRVEDAAAVFHGASKHIGYFRLLAEAQGITPTRFGKTSAKQLRRFGEVFAEVVEPHVDFAALSKDQVWTTHRNAKNAGATSIAERCLAVHVAGSSAPSTVTPPSETSGAVATAKPTEEVLALLAMAPSRVNKVAFHTALQLLPTLDEPWRTNVLDWAYRAVGDSRERNLAIYDVLPKLPAPADTERRQSWLASLNNAAIVTWRGKDFELSRRLVEAAGTHAREYPPIFHAAACTYVSLGDLDKAFELVKLAVECDYDGLSRMRDDEDLGALRRRADFRDLFLRRKR